MNRQENLLRRLAALDRISQALACSSDLDIAIENGISEIFSIFGVDRAWLLFPCDPDAEFFQIPFEKTKPEFPGALELKTNVLLDDTFRDLFRNHLLTKDPIFFTIPDESDSYIFKKFHIQSQISIAMHPRNGKPWLLGMHQCSFARKWTKEERKLLAEIAQRFSEILETLIVLRELEVAKNLLAEKAEKNAKKLQETEYFLKKVVESTSNAIHVLDRGGFFRFCNSRFCEAIGYTNEEILGRHFSFLIHPRSLEMIRRNVREVLEKGREFRNVHFEIITKEKKIITVRSAGNPFLEDGKITGVVCIAEDITQEKCNREKLTDVYKHVGLINRKMGVLLETKEALKKNAEENIPLLLENGRKISGADFCGIFLFDKKEGYFELLASEGIPPEKQREMAILSPHECLLVCQMIEKEKSISASMCHFPSNECPIALLGIKYFFAPMLFWGGKMRGIILFGFFDDMKMEKINQELCEFFAVEASFGLFGEEDGHTEN